MTLVLARIFLRRKRHSDIIDSRAFIPTTGLLFLLFSAAHALVVAIGFLIVGDAGPAILPVRLIGETGLWIAALLTLVTGYDYLRAGLGHIVRATEAERLAIDKKAGRTGSAEPV